MKLKNKRVVVTGSDGFIGSHLVEKLLENGAKVKAFCYYNSFSSYGWLDTFDKAKLKKIEIFMGDVRDPYGVRKALKDQDMVFHLAALIGIPYSYHSPDNYVDTNIKGTLNVLQAAKDFKTERVLVTSTSEVYGTAQYVPIDEAHPFQPQSPYSATKIAADSMAEAFYRSFDLPLTIVRPFNTYGPRQSARAVIPTVISQILSGAKVLKLGDLRPKRDLNYVKDVCCAFLAIAENNSLIGEHVNIASSQDISIKELVDTIINLTAAKVKIELQDERFRPKKSEVMRLQGSNKKIKKFIGWQPRYTLKQGLAETIAWFKDNLASYKPDLYNV